MAYWRFNNKSRRYYVTTQGAAALGIKAGSFIGAGRVSALRDEIIDIRKDRVTDAAVKWGDGGSLVTFGEGMIDEIRSITIDQYLLARGGRDAMTADDWGRIGGLVSNQNKYLRRFLERIDNGKYSPLQVAMISRMYMASSVRAFELGKLKQQGIGNLPVMPGDGKTKCLSNCRCRWRIVERRNDWLCYWTLGTAEHCEDCQDRAREYNPLLVPKPIEMRIAT